MPTPCAKVKTLRKILAEVLSAGDFEWANLQYCARDKRLTKKVCPDDIVESPIACTQSVKCAKPLLVITTGLGSPPSWPLEWEVETRIVQKDWHKNIKPGGTLCLVNSAMEGHCLKFKDRFSPSEKQRLQAHPTEKAASDLVRDLAESICEISLTKSVKQLFSPSIPPFLKGVGGLVKGVGGFNGKENKSKN